MNKIYGTKPKSIISCKSSSNSGNVNFKSKKQIDRLINQIDKRSKDGSFNIGHNLAMSITELGDRV